MPNFDAETVVDPMRFRFKPDGEYRVIPEPSTLQVQAFMNAQSLERERVRKELADLPDDEPLEETLKRLGPQQVKAMVKRNAKMFADVCSGTPSAEELEQLPHRVFAAFADWARAEILNPEGASGAGRTAASEQSSAAAA